MFFLTCGLELQHAIYNMQYSDMQRLITTKSDILKCGVGEEMIEAELEKNFKQNHVEFIRSVDDLTNTTRCLCCTLIL